MKRAALLLALAACAAAPPAPDAREDASDRLRAQLTEADDIKRGFILDELAKVELRRAQEANTTFAYRRFLSEFPHGEESATARTLLENLVFEEASKAGTQAEWNAFLEEFPRGKRAPEARARLGALVIAEVAKSTDVELVRRTLGRFPEHEKRPLLVAREDELSWNEAKAGEMEAVSRYLATHPGGAYRHEALDRKDALERRDILESEDLERARARAAAADAEPEAKKLVAELELERALRTLDPEALLHVAALDGAGEFAERAKALAESLARVPLAPEVRAAMNAAAPGAGLDAHETLVEKAKHDDPLVRVEALRELAEVAAAQDLDLVLEATESRYIDVRLEAAETLRTYARALPKALWRRFVSARETEALTRALSAAPWRRVAVLRDADGRGKDALAAYQEVLKADPDDLASRSRALSLEQEQGDRLGLSSTARELSKGALSFADGRWLQPPDPYAPAEERRDGPGRILGVRADVTVLRQMCAAIALGERASATLGQLRTAAGPGEQELLGLAVSDAERTLSRLRSKRIELESQAKKQDPAYLPCGTDRAAPAIAASRSARIAAVKHLAALADPRTAAFVASLANTPSNELRAAALEAAKVLAEAPEPKAPEPLPAPAPEPAPLPAKKSPKKR